MANLTPTTRTKLIHLIDYFFVPNDEKSAAYAAIKTNTNTDRNNFLHVVLFF